jgi:hypothetical protein
MKRRNFIAASVAATAYSANSWAGSTDHHEAGEQEIIEVQKYQLNIGPGKNRVGDFYRDAAIPAMNRAGIQNVGVFSVMYGPNSPSLYVLIPHKNFSSFLHTPTKLMEDADYQKAGAEFLNTPLSDPAYVRTESTLYMAFSDMPKVEPPVNMLNNKSRIYEVRIYESHSRKYGQKKIEMFNAGGEIDIFRKTGLQPVFFGETIAGAMMPNLTYMLVFENMAARDKNWTTFRNSPEWTKLKADQQYKDTVSNITDIILRPAGFSQI